MSIAARYCAPSSSIDLALDVEAELAYWRKCFRDLPGCSQMRLEDIKPALKLGTDAALQARGRDFDEIADELQIRYHRIRGESLVPWDQARPVVRAVWEHACRSGVKPIRPDYAPARLQQRRTLDFSRC